MKCVTQLINSSKHISLFSIPWLKWAPLWSPHVIVAQLIGTFAPFFIAILKDYRNKLKSILSVFCTGTSRVHRLQRTWSSLWTCEFLSPQSLSPFNTLPPPTSWMCLLKGASATCWPEESLKLDKGKHSSPPRLN